LLPSHRHQCCKAPSGMNPQGWEPGGGPSPGSRTRVSAQQQHDLGVMSSGGTAGAPGGPQPLGSQSGAGGWQQADQPSGAGGGPRSPSRLRYSYITTAPPGVQGVWSAPGSVHQHSANTPFIRVEQVAEAGDAAQVGTDEQEGGELA